MENSASLEVGEIVEDDEAVFPLVGRRGPCSVEGADLVQLPLWLTGEEAEALTYMCATSAANTDAEQIILSKLGNLLRAFRR